MWMDLGVVLALLSVLLYEGTEIKCGIKLVTWVSIYILSMFLRVAISSTKQYIFNHFPDMGPVYSLISFLIVDVFVLSWQVYGVQLLKSKNHTCSEKAPFLYNMIILLLFMGCF
jgi:hypothetical protein